MFKGSIVALITPFKNNKIDEDRYASLIHYHISNGTKGLVPAGTTGESPTLDHMNTKRLLRLQLKSQMEKFLLLQERGLILLLKQSSYHSMLKKQEQTPF